MASPKRARTLPEVDDALTGLAKAVERHSRMITAGRGETAKLATLVEQLSTSLRATSKAWATSQTARLDQDESGAADLQSPSGEGASTRAELDESALASWLVTTDFETGHSLSDDVTRWVRSVYLRWPDAVLPACWSLHPWVVEELWVLRCCWFDARTGENASWLRWQDWHDRQRPATARRISEGLQDCCAEQHVPPAGGPYPEVPGADVVPVSVTAWASEGHHAWPPTVGSDLLSEPDRRRHHNSAQRSHGVPRRTLTPPGSHQ